MLLLGTLLGGCHASPWASGKNDSPPASVANTAKNGPNANEPKNGTKAAASQPSQKSADSADKPSAGETPANQAAGNPSANAQSLQEVMAEVRELGVLDPQQQNKLLEDLRQTDPALWPLMVKQVRAAVAYRRKSMDQRQTNAPEAALAAVPASILPRDPVTNSANSSAEEEIAQVMPLGNDDEQTCDNSGGMPSRLPPQKTAKSISKKDKAAISPEVAPAVAVTSKQKATGAKSSSAKTRDYKSIDAQSLGAADEVTPVSYESPNSAEIETAKPIADITANSTSHISTDQESAPNNTDWHAQLEQTIKAMEADLPQKPKTAEDLSKQARLRMLYALAGRREDAAKPIPTAPPAMQDFWSKELYGLTVLLDTERMPDAMTRAAEAKQHLSEGFTRLGEMAPLQVRNLSFCTVVQSYGCYTPFKKYEFLPDQEVLLYAEVENFGIESTAKGYHTSLRSSYQVLDKSGQRIADHAISTTEEYCQNPRRDFFIGYQLRMPARINPGKYTLQLTIEDLKSQKVGQAAVELTIKGGEKEKTGR